MNPTHTASSIRQHNTMSSSSNNNKNNNSFDKYCSRLGYPHSMAKDAKSKLGSQASTSELLAAVLNNAKSNNVQPNRSAQPGYLQRQVRYYFFRSIEGRLIPTSVYFFQFL